MNGGSKYAGIAATFVFGVGLLLMGKVWPGIGVLVVGVLSVVFVLSAASGKALVVAIGALICSAVFVCQGASNEITGNAIYRHGVGRGSWTEPVTRQDSPVKFRQATNLKWGMGIITALVSVSAFMFYRKLEDSDDFF